MALTLANTIAADDLEIEVNGVVPAAIDIGYRFRMDDEFMEVRAFGRRTVTVLGGAATESVRNANVWILNRGLERTTWATHTSGASVLGTLPAVVVGDDEDLPDPFAESGGGTSVHDDLTGRDAADQHPIAAVEGLEAALAAAQPKLDAPAVDVDANVGGIAQTSGIGIANANHYAESGDGAANANSTAGSGTGDASATRRAEVGSGAGAANASTVSIAIDGDAAANTDVSSTAGAAEAITTVTGVGGANANRTAEVPSGDESATAITTATTAGAGGADVRNTATSAGAGEAAVGGIATSGSGIASAILTATTATGEANLDLRARYTDGTDKVAGIQATADATSARMGFFNATPVAQPEIPASPTEQDIVDALVALGLVTQAAP